MNGWHPIEPEPQCLTESELAVKKLLDRGWSYPMIAIKLHMSHETTRDIIFEIRKKEGIMRKPTITDEEKQTMKRMFAEGKTIQEIADATGRGRSSVDRIVHVSSRKRKIQRTQNRSRSPDTFAARCMTKSAQSIWKSNSVSRESQS